MLMVLVATVATGMAGLFCSKPNSFSLKWRSSTPVEGYGSRDERLFSWNRVLVQVVPIE